MTPDEQRYRDLLIATIYSIVKRYGEDNNIVLLDGMKDLPKHVTIGWNIVGDDVIVTVLEGEEKNASQANS